MTCGDKRGTDAGYARHMRAWDQPCPDCRSAHADYMRRYRVTGNGARQSRLDRARRAWAIRELIAAHEYEYRQLLLRARLEVDA